MSDYSALSLNKGVMVCGIEIKKLHIGAYLQALAKIAELPDTLFERKSFAEAVSELANAKGDNARKIIGYLVDTVPVTFIKFVGGLIGVDGEKLINDETIGLDGLMEIVCAFIEVNGLKKCLSLWNGLREA